MGVARTVNGGRLILAQPRQLCCNGGERPIKERGLRNGCVGESRRPAAPRTHARTLQLAQRHLMVAHGLLQLLALLLDKVVNLR